MAAALGPDPEAFGARSADGTEVDDGPSDKDALDGDVLHRTVSGLAPLPRIGDSKERRRFSADTPPPTTSVRNDDTEICPTPRSDDEVQTPWLGSPRYIAAQGRRLRRDSDDSDQSATWCRTPQSAGLASRAGTSNSRSAQRGEAAGGLGSEAEDSLDEFPMSPTLSNATQTNSVRRARSPRRGSGPFRRSESQETRLDSDKHLVVLDPEFLRAVSSRRVLRSKGLWTNRVGDESTFQASRPVQWMHVFLSHTWLTPGWLKKLSLAYIFNISRAVVSALLVHLTICTLEVTGSFRFLVPVSQTGEVLAAASSVTLRFDIQCVASMIVFWVILRWGQELPLPETRCFLDKCCIHQTDPDKKEAGIKQLGAFLRNSKQMLVLLEPTYMKRLWCMYELAAFLYINGGSCEKVKIQPLKLIQLSVCLIAFHCFTALVSIVVLPLTVLDPHVVDWMLEHVSEPVQVPFLFAALFAFFFTVFATPSVVLWKVCKAHAHECGRLYAEFTQFSISRVECSQTKDRDFVEMQIMEWFGGIAQYESYVRTEVAMRVDQLINTAGPIPYRMVLLGSLGSFLMGVSLAINAWVDHGHAVFWHVCLGCFSLIFCADAIALNVLFWLIGAGYWLNNDENKRGCFSRKLAGPLATGLLFSFFHALSACMIAPKFPLWLGCGACGVQSALVCWQYSSAPRHCMRPVSLARGA